MQRMEAILALIIIYAIVRYLAWSARQRERRLWGGD